MAWRSDAAHWPVRLSMKTGLQLKQAAARPGAAEQMAYFQKQAHDPRRPWQAEAPTTVNEPVQK